MSRRTWRAEIFVRSYERYMFGDVQRSPGGWEWSIVNLRGWQIPGKEEETSGAARTARLAKTACDRAAAKLGLLKRGAGLGR